MIRHIVFWKFLPGKEAETEEFFARLSALDGVIPEIRHMEIRKAVGGEYDAALISDFDDLAALDRYKNDPRHKAVSALCKSIRESRASLDYER